MARGTTACARSLPRSGRDAVSVGRHWDCCDVLGPRAAPRLEQLINGLVYELFFPDDLHAAGIRLFDACEREHVTRLATLQGAALETEAEALEERVFSNNHPIYAMIFDLQALDVVNINEARD